MVLSEEMREVGRRAISIALSGGHEIVDVPHLVAALTRPADDEPRRSGGMTVFSENVSGVIGRAQSHAKADGSSITTRRHLVAALLDLDDPAVTAALAGFEPGEDHLSARAVERFNISHHFEPSEMTVRLQRRS